MADYRKIIQSQHFTLLVGEKVAMTIHAGVVKDVSEPLHTLISNGLQESTSRVGVLGDVDVDTFTALCEHLCTGSYTTPSRATSDTGDKSTDEKTEPQTTSNVTSKAPNPHRSPLVASDQTPNAPISFLYPQKDMKRKGQKAVTDELIKHFFNLRCNGNPASDAPEPDLLFHIRLYVLATRFLVDSLRQQCLKSLHRDLSNPSLRKSTGWSLVFLNTRIGTLHGLNLEGESQLRELMIHYASGVEKLGRLGAFRGLLASDGEIGADLVMKLAI